MRNLWRARCAAALLTLASFAASAAEITKLGVMSVLGGEIQLVIRSKNTSEVTAAIRKGYLAAGMAS